MEKKEQLAKVEKMLGSYKLAEEKGDQSILRYSIFFDSLKSTPGFFGKISRSIETVSKVSTPNKGLAS